MKNILILGSGGREHALSWKISQSPKCKKLFIAPGNAGTSNTGTNVNLNILDFEEVRGFVDKEDIHLIVVGPEAPLVEGIYDYFNDHEVHVIGPSKQASQLEGSKAFANDFMKEFNIPTAGYLTITKASIEKGFEFIDQQKDKIVLKADGLAAGKGVLIIDDKTQAKDALRKMLEGQFGQASETVVIEEFLDGIEFSVFVATDGEGYQILPVAKDYKRIGEGDTGLNTGGMGAVSPVPFVSDELMQKVKDQIIEPTIHGLNKRAYTYKGFIFLGLIKVDEDPFVIEYNCRLGDPETEVVIPRIKNDFVDILEAISDKSINNCHVEISEESAATIMLVSGGYPESYEKNKLITGIEAVEDSIVFHAGTKTTETKTLTNGGRVMAITSLEKDFRAAIHKSLRNIKRIQFEKMDFRNDIGFDL
ncbi:MAG: phosphoribosylamine--glycine ligase [Bacteroidia bacterium]|nr:phosphoribosylamine--glycine ligase [Bacteroidia bacterium]